MAALIDYDMISTGLKKGRTHDWRFMTRGIDGRFFLWSCEPKIGSDGDWCMRSEDITNTRAVCAELPFVPEIFICDMDLLGSRAVRMWEIDYNSSYIDRILNSGSDKVAVEVDDAQGVLF